MTPVGARHELFYDTETALRLVDGEVRAMTEGGAAHSVPASGALSPYGPAASPLVLDRASAEIRAVLANLRDSRTEILGMVGALRAEDVTTRHLAYAANVLTDMEERLSLIARLVNPLAEVRAALDGPAPRTCDPIATTHDAERREAPAGEVVVATR